MGRKTENVSFICGNCSKRILPLTNGSFRNHCPYCLYSVHVDIDPGDRQNSCKGLMEPIGLMHHSKKGMQVIHQCVNCLEVKVNRIAENTIQPDNTELLIKISR